MIRGCSRWQPGDSGSPSVKASFLFVVRICSTELKRLRELRAGMRGENSAGLILKDL